MYSFWFFIFFLLLVGNKFFFLYISDTSPLIEVWGLIARVEESRMHLF